VLTVKAIAGFVILFVLSIVCLAQHAKPSVSLEEAKKLVNAGLPPRTRHLPKFGLEEGRDPNCPQFYFFTAYWAGAPNGSMVIGNYAVDKLTADVWNAPAACDELNSPELRKLQAQVRSRMGLTDTGYRNTKRRCPLEMEDQTGICR
jgi:hypothetical protein